MTVRGEQLADGRWRGPGDVAVERPTVTCNGRPLHSTELGPRRAVFRLRFPLYLYKLYYIPEARSAVTVILRRALRWVKAVKAGFGGNGDQPIEHVDSHESDYPSWSPSRAKGQLPNARRAQSISSGSSRRPARSTDVCQLSSTSHACASSCARPDPYFPTHISP